MPGGRGAALAAAVCVLLAASVAGQPSECVISDMAVINDARAALAAARRCPLPPPPSLPAAALCSSMPHRLLQGCAGGERHHSGHHQCGVLQLRSQHHPQLQRRTRPGAVLEGARVRWMGSNGGISLAHPVCFVNIFEAIPPVQPAGGRRLPQSSSQMALFCHAQDGELLPPPEAAAAPNVTIVSGGDALFTMLTVDPDAPDPANPTRRSILHWLVKNVPAGGSASEGTEVSDVRHAMCPVGRPVCWR